MRWLWRKVHDWTLARIRGRTGFTERKRAITGALVALAAGAMVAFRVIDRAAFDAEDWRGVPDEVVFALFCVCFIYGIYRAGLGTLRVLQGRGSELIGSSREYGPVRDRAQGD